MKDFDPGSRHDVLPCLFSSIGYLKEAGNVVSAFRCFRRNVKPGGLVIRLWNDPGRHGRIVESHDRETVSSGEPMLEQAKRWSMVAEFSNHAEAELARNLLEGHGIRAAIWSDDCGGLACGQSFVQGVRIFVAPSDREAAAGMLGTPGDGER